jgi:hypothetical protein
MPDRYQSKQERGFEKVARRKRDRGEKGAEAEENENRGKG